MEAMAAGSCDPEYVTWKGEKYPINTDFRVAARCLEIGNDPSAGGTERVLATIYLLFGIFPEDGAMMEFFYEKARKFLLCGEDELEHESRKKDMDLKADYRYIEASFQSDYQIDLSAVQMHWWRFMRLLGGLTEHSVLSRIREIRNYDLSDLPSQKARDKMAKAKRELALPEEKTEFTDEEKEMIRRFNSL